MHVVQPIYLACFCEEDNLLNQWRTYGQSGGYSLGFQVPALDFLTGQGFKPEPCTYTSKWVKVEYDKKEQITRCNEILDAVLPAFDGSETAQAFAVIGHWFMRESPPCSHFSGTFSSGKKFRLRHSSISAPDCAVRNRARSGVSIGNP
jgi:hypothetical protein